MSHALELRDVTVGRAGGTIISGLNLTIDEGEVVGLLGPNGAGKSSTLLTIAGGLRPLHGEILLRGVNVAGRPPYALARAGIRLIPEGRSVIQSLTVAENLRLVRKAVLDPTQFFPQLLGLKGRRAGLCSGGEQQMLALGMALAADARVLLIDELSLGLAPALVQALLPVIRTAADTRGIAVLLVEQQIEAALDVADRAIVVAQGSVQVSGTATELKAQLRDIEAAYLGVIKT